MAGLDNLMEHSTNAQTIKVGKEDAAEKQRQKEFYAKLRARTAEQPVGAQYK